MGTPNYIRPVSVKHQTKPARHEILILFSSLKAAKAFKIISFHYFLSSLSLSFFFFISFSPQTRKKEAVIPKIPVPNQSQSKGTPILSNQI
jgi:hypothetical protein